MTQSKPGRLSRREWLWRAAATCGSLGGAVGLSACGGGEAGASAPSPGLLSVASPPAATPAPGPVAGGPPPAPAAPAPAPAPPPVYSGFVNASLAESSWQYASKALVMAWTQGGGDWTDADGAANGPKPLRNGTPAGADGIMTIDIAGIDGDLFLRRGANFDAAFIDGEPATALWMHPTSNRAMAPPTQYLADESTAIVLNPKRGKVLTLHVTRPWGMEVFKLRTPAVVDYPMLANAAGLLPPDMGTLDPVSQAVVYAAVGQGAGASVEYWAYDPQPGVDAAHGNLPYLRCAITPQNQKGIGWFWWHEPKTEIYERFCLWLEDDIALGMTELGVKLPGPEGGEGMSWRMLQGRPDRANPGLYAILDYRYSADSGGGFGVETPGYAGTLVKTGRWYVFEQHVRANTFNADGSARNDGVAEFWLNNHPINRSDAIRWFDAATGRFEKFFINLYHGGMGLPTQDIHYRIAKLARSTTRIGVPRELLLA